MLWIRGLDTLSSNRSSYFVEVELGSEIDIPGALSFENDAILFSLATSRPDSSGLYKYCLRLSIPLENYTQKDFSKDCTRNGYVFKEGAVGELVSLFSLKLQARLFILSSITRFGPNSLPIKTEYNPYRGLIGSDFDTVVFSNGNRHLHNDLFGFIRKIKKIPPKYHLEVALSANHYANALREIGLNEEMVFVRLVSAIETAAAHQSITSDPWEAKNLDEFIKTDDLNIEQINELKVLFQNRRSKSRFIAFLQKYSERFFDSEKREPEHTQVTPENLSKIAGAIYDARSGYIHNGTPMYLSRPNRFFPDWHMDCSVGIYLHNRFFKNEQKLPRADFFHRLVRHCLLSRIDELSAIN